MWWREEREGIWGCVCLLSFDSGKKPTLLCRFYFTPCSASMISVDVRVSVIPGLAGVLVF